MSFSLDLSKFAEKAKMSADQVVRHVTLEIAENVVFRTPVGNPSVWLSLNPYTDMKTGKVVTSRKPPPGYVGGRARANWQFAEGEIPAGEVDEVDPRGNSTVARLAGQIAQSRAGGVTYIANNLPYILPLEYGHSQQAPAGMVRVALTEYQQYIRNAVAQLGGR